MIIYIIGMMFMFGFCINVSIKNEGFISFLKIFFSILFWPIALGIIVEEAIGGLKLRE